MFGNKSIGQIARYGIIGVSTNTIGYLLYLVVTFVGVEPKMAMTILYVIGVIISFFLNRRWTFTHKGKISTAAARFIAVYFVGYLINLILLYVFFDIYGYGHSIVQLGAMLILVVYLFVTLKLFVFK